jgi:predicted AAA+ superfamily ATPase
LHENYKEHVAIFMEELEINRLKFAELEELIAEFPVVGIIGARQVGKTTLAKKLLGSLIKNYVYFDLELPSDIAKLNEPELLFRQYEDQTIILDEIQFKPELFALIRALVDENRKPGRFIILGSTSPEMLRKSSDSLAGRISYIHLHPLNLLEIETANLYNMNTLWLRGGFPNSLDRKTDAKSMRWRQEFINAYCQKDLPLLGLPINPAFNLKLLQMLANYNGQILNVEQISKSLGIARATTSKYLDYLEGAFIIRPIQPFYINISKRLVKSPKLYFTDTGLLHALLGINTFEQLLSNPSVGNSWESFVFQQIISLNQLYSVHYYRTHQGGELDMLLVTGNQVEYALEIKYSASPKLSKGNYSSFDDLSPKNRYIISPTNSSYLYDKETRVVSLHSFLSILKELHYP